MIFLNILAIALSAYVLINLIYREQNANQSDAITQLSDIDYINYEDLNRKITFEDQNAFDKLNLPKQTLVFKLEINELGNVVYAELVNNPVNKISPKDKKTLLKIIFRSQFEPKLGSGNSGLKLTKSFQSTELL